MDCCDCYTSSKGGLYFCLTCFSQRQTRIDRLERRIKELEDCIIAAKAEFAKYRNPSNVPAYKIIEILDREV